MLDSRVESLLDEMGDTMLCYLPDDEPISADQFVLRSEQLFATTTTTLARCVQFSSTLVHSASTQLY